MLVVILAASSQQGKPLYKHTCAGNSRVACTVSGDGKYFGNPSDWREKIRWFGNLDDLYFALLAMR